MDIATAEKIAVLGQRIVGLQVQMKELLAKPISEAQKEAVNLGHQMSIDEFQERINALEMGEPDPWG